MAEEKVVKITGGIGLGSILFLIFLVLKLTGYINWSWWWVTSPIWIPIAVFVLISLIAFIGFLILKD